MGAAAEWAGAWASWEVQAGREAASQGAGHRLAHRPMRGLTSWASEGCPASAVVEEAAAVGVVVAFLLVAQPSSTCRQTSVRQCTPDLVSTPCCRQGQWGVLAEADLRTLGLACLPSSSTGREATRSTAHLYLVAGAHEGHHTAPCPQ